MKPITRPKKKSIEMSSSQMFRIVAGKYSLRSMKIVFIIEIALYQARLLKVELTI